ncbi:YfbU family protein [Shewanella marina]|uniref:YfbU family protein n=1 Tax=Shewanella marina TaxID=487319 RepID=UPI00046FAAE2|nr:YfbU family protein [Shewanella marina]
MSTKNIEISEVERLTLVNQFLILEKLYPEDAKYYEINRIALKQGYQAHYRMIFEDFSNEMPVEQTKEVLDILEMYNTITLSSLDNNSIDTKYRFLGFDGNEESEQLSYCYYFIVKLDRYRELVSNRDYPDFNSHCPMLPKYRRMLSVWKRIREQHSSRVLTSSQIEQIFEAR